MRHIFLLLTVLVAGLSALPAEAASRGTARASADIPVRDGPGTDYYIIGTLAGGTRVHLEHCTRDSSWCLFLDADGRPAGWVRGSYLVGSGAKLEVTTRKFLGFDPLDPLNLCRDDDDDDWDASSVCDF